MLLLDGNKKSEHNWKDDRIYLEKKFSWDIIESVSVFTFSKKIDANDSLFWSVVGVVLSLSACLLTDSVLDGCERKFLSETNCQQK